jgi:hypothetical protein
MHGSGIPWKLSVSSGSRDVDGGSGNLSFPFV